MKVWMGVLILVGMLANGTVLAANDGVGGGFSVSAKASSINGMGNRQSKLGGKRHGLLCGYGAWGRITLQYLEEWLKNGHAKICLSADYVESLGVQAIVNFLNDHHGKMKHEAELIKILALKAEYPCVGGRRRFAYNSSASELPAYIDI